LLIVDVDNDRPWPAEHLVFVVVSEDTFLWPLTFHYISQCNPYIVAPPLIISLPYKTGSFIFFSLFFFSTTRPQTHKRLFTPPPFHLPSFLPSSNTSTINLPDCHHIRCLLSSPTTLLLHFVSRNRCPPHFNVQTHCRMNATEPPAAPVIGSQYNAGDIAWTLASTALVWLMIPGIGYFYSGMARSKNALSLIMLSCCSIAVVTVQVSYSSLFFLFPPLPT
jgi:hypothetical protein